MEGIQIYELKRMDLRGATVIDGFPSVGLVSSIVANYLINALNLTQIGIMDSIYFPTVALVRDGQPMNPVRIYAGPKVDDRDQIVVFISEFQPPPNLIKAIAATVLDWAQDARCNPNRFTTRPTWRRSRPNPHGQACMARREVRRSPASRRVLE